MPAADILKVDKLAMFHATLQICLMCVAFVLEGSGWWGQATCQSVSMHHWKLAESYFPGASYHWTP